MLTSDKMSWKTMKSQKILLNRKVLRGITMDFNEERIAYLQMIESIIDRMSNKSGNIKGFAVSIVAGVNLSLDLKESEIKMAKATKLQCLTSKSIYYFYIPLALVMIIILGFKFNGLI